ncbi:FkbM family methyltransferase [Amorphoplanes digitatis]|uniref:FkbM family methyltransferase n=1 Tax=Actinoplanes digitatis TaxID=1868 RepID=A0A7W7HSV1_9ACTN|nr:FkbM family methyltransferase [Actinoplanes digitatis]MBB4760142.1 FkbM family methyltransferase [Actinoplanes digitatis]GID94846.1 putative methyltransferase [Actinoplanes digitatis]
MVGTLFNELSSRFAAALPARAVGAAVRTAYPRVEPELARLATYAPRGGTAVDVGAWYGPWTRGLRRIADQVVSFEPTAELAGCVAAAFPDVRVIQAVASDHSGTAELFLPSGGPGVGTSSLEYGTGSSVTVARMTVDELELRDVRFVKLDVEGHEMPALRGAEQTIRRDLPMLMVELEERIQPVQPVLDLLAGWGYRPYVMPDDRWLPLEGFDLIGHQRAALGRVDQSFARRVIRPKPRYVNMVLFRPELTR